MATDASSLMEPPIVLSGLFGDDDDDGDASDGAGEAFEEQFGTQSLDLSGETLEIREFSFHPQNANRVWPGTFALVAYLARLLGEPEPSARRAALGGARVLELGAATGVVSIWLRRLGVAATTSDVVDEGEVARNIAHNAQLNGVGAISHVEHTWGEAWGGGEFDVVVASDILLYTAAYEALVQTLMKLMAGKPSRSFVMVWLRRLKHSDGTDSSVDFFTRMREAGFSCRHEGNRVFTFAHGAARAELSALEEGAEGNGGSYAAAWQ